MPETAVGGSFRDPSGYVYRSGERLFRRVLAPGAKDYDQLMSSGLYDALVEQHLLVPHREVGDPSGSSHRTLEPELVDFVSYPYEWCVGQLRDAALATLRAQRIALDFGMCLKDASAYNVQLQRGRPTLIDTLSFEAYVEGTPWVAYRQFCQHFLAPLALMARCDVRLGRLLQTYLDGIPLDLASDLLPRRTWLNPNLWMHLRLHASFQRRYEGSAEKVKQRTIAKSGLMGVIAALEAAVRRMKPPDGRSEWSAYYDGDSYEADSFAHKRELVARHLKEIAPGCVWDLGANTGEFSRLAAEAGASVVSFDGDPACVERSWQTVRERGEEHILPLVLDLAAPSPAVGWANVERSSLAQRANADLVLALALVHHLAIGNNVPLERVAEFFAGLAPALVVEFVPKSDAKVQTLLANREDVFDDYHGEGLEAAFSRFYRILESTPIRGSDRVLYRMERASEVRS